MPMTPLIPTDPRIERRSSVARKAPNLPPTAYMGSHSPPTEGPFGPHSMKKSLIRNADALIEGLEISQMSPEARSVTSNPLGSVINQKRKLIRSYTWSPSLTRSAWTYSKTPA